MSPLRLLRVQELGARDADVELRVQILKSFLQGYICEKISKKELKNKKFGNPDGTVKLAILVWSNQ